MPKDQVRRILYSYAVIVFTVVGNLLHPIRNTQYALFLKIVLFEEDLSGCRPPEHMISVIVESFQVYSARLAKVTLKKWFFLGFTWPLRRFLLSRLAPTGKRIESHVQMESNFEPKTQIVEVEF